MMDILDDYDPLAEDLAGDPLAEDLTGDPLAEDLTGDPLAEDLTGDLLAEDDGLSMDDIPADSPGLGIDDIPAAAIVDFDEMIQIDEPDEDDNANYDSEDLGSLAQYGLLKVKY